MTTATVQAVIESSYRLAVQTSEGEGPTAQYLNDALEAFDLMVDSWNAERLSVFATQDQLFTWPANTISRTLGPTGTLGVGLRPVLIDDSTYFRDASTGISYGLKLINQQQYDGIAVKTVTSTYPQVMFANDKFPDTELFLYPVPTKALEFHFISVQQLTQPATLATSLAFPPGYLRAFKFNLACELSAELGIEPPPTVARIAVASKRVLKRINSPMDIMSLPYSIVGTRQRFNVFSGNF